MSGQIRKRRPLVRIVLRADSGFAREALIAWCEANGADYVFGLARNARLVAGFEAGLAAAGQAATASGKPERRFQNFRYSTRDRVATNDGEQPQKFGGYKLRDVKTPLIVRFKIESQKTGRSPAMVQKIMSDLRMLFTSSQAKPKPILQSRCGRSAANGTRNQ